MNIKKLFRNQDGVTLIEAMIGLMIFVLGFAGSFSLMSTSFQQVRKSWDFVVAQEILEYQYQELYYRIKIAHYNQNDNESLDPQDSSSFVKLAFPGQFNSATGEVCRLIVGRPDQADLSAAPPHVYVDGLNFNPAPVGDAPGFEVCWQAVRTLEVEFGREYRSSQFFSIQSNNFREALEMDPPTVFEITVSWPYYQDGSSGRSSSLSKSVVFNRFL